MPPDPRRERTPGADPGARQKVAGRPTYSRRRYSYPGQGRPIWQVLSDIRRRHWWKQPELTDEEAESVFLAFVGDGTQRAALGRLIHELHEYGRLQRIDLERRRR